MTSTKPLVDSITYHCWNKDQTQLALSPNTNEVWIYSCSGTDPSKWVRTAVLDEHGGQVSGIDWCPETNLIVTCGHDRNAYVWRFDEKTKVWKPTLVILRINRAATSVKWSPAGNKFAVASGAKCVPVCHFESGNDWWISKMIKKHKSTVLSLAWCPNNKFIVTGSSDMKCRVFSAFLDNLDPSDDDGFGEVWPKQHEFGEILCEFDQAKSWVHSVAWSMGGFRVAFGGHGSNISFVQFLAGSQPVVQTINRPDLPYLDLQFVSDSCVVGSGYDFNIDSFTVTGGSEVEPVWSFKEKLDKASKGVSESKSPTASAGQFGASKALFANAVDRAVGGSTSTAVEPNTKHKNIIVNLQACFDASGKLKRVTTAGIDGRIVFWDMKV